ncbi:MAG TPA: cytochrome B [Thiolapillus brandeum]|uniref:Cytochrome B n=1 Tax=Thiolapillus brandeum TaxID=1076588 RepID=A0A831NYC1_9GAMM|nr:cytochrome B [Thiolapillus brandeum]
MNTENVRREIKIWDPLVRIFHWTLVVSFVVDYASGDELTTIHIWFGYLITGLLVFRIIWGFVGPKHARFSDFVYPPGEIITYVKSLVSGKPARYLGHNPAGGLMVILLLVSLGFTVGTGLLMIQTPKSGTLQVTDAQSSWLVYEDDDEHKAHEGNEAFEEIHEFFANLTLLLVLLHIAGVVVSSRIHRENLVRSMINGKKPADPKP